MLENKQILAYDDPSKTFLGVRFVLLGFESDKEDEVRFKLLEGGGIDAVNYGPDCNHVIVDKLVDDDPVCIAARRDGKILVTGLWVDHSFDLGMPVDPTSVMYRPMKDLNGIPGAKYLVVCLTGYQRQDRDDIMTMVALMGANFLKPLAANKVTHLICYKFEGEKYELAKKMKKIKLVNHLWLEDCLKAWELLPEADYSKSGQELELEAEAKDSEGETEDMDPVTDMARKNVASPQNTRLENKNPHKSPAKPDISTNNSYSSASKHTPNLRDSSKILSTPGKEINFEETSANDNHLETRTTFSGRSPGKKSSEMPLNDSKVISEKVENVLASASLSAKKSPNAELSKLSGKYYYGSTPKKSTLPLRPENLDTNSGSPSTSDVRNLEGLKTPLKGTPSHIDEGQTGPLSNKRRTALSRDSSKSPTLTGSVGAKKGEEEASLASKEASKVPATSEDRAESNNQALQRSCKGSKRRNLSNVGRTEPEVLKTPVKGNIDEGRNSSLSSKRKAELSRDSSKSPMLIESEMSKRMEEEASLSPKESSKIYGTSEDRDEGNDQALQRSAKGSKKRTLTNGERTDSEGLKTSLKDHTGEGQNGPLSSNRKTEDLSHGNSKSPMLIGSEMGKRMEEEASLAPKEGFKIFVPSEDRDNDKNDTPSSRADISTGELVVKQIDLEKMDGQDDLSLPKVGPTGTRIKPLKRKLLAKKTLDARPFLSKKQEGSVNGQKAVLQNDDIMRPNPTITEDGSVNDKAKASEGSNKVKSAEVEAPESGEEAIVRSKKQANGKPEPMKEKVAKSVRSKKSPEGELAGCSNITDLTELKSTGEKKLTKGKKRPFTKSKQNLLDDSRDEVKVDGQDEKETVALAGKTKKRPSKKLKSSSDWEKENNEPTIVEQPSGSNEMGEVGKMASQSLKMSLKNGLKADKVKSDPACFILSGHRLQRKEFHQVIKRLKGRVCRDSHHWSYQATHFVVSDPVRRTEKFFAAAASGSWILKTDYLTASNEAGRLLSEEPYEWNKKCLTEDGAINLEAPRKWRLLRERTGHGAFFGMQIVIYGECIAPSLDTLKRVVKAGDGTILATSPPYTRFLQSIDFAVISPGMPRVDMWVQEFLRHEVPCIVADYLVEYVCKPGYSLERHVQYNTHAWAKKSLDSLMNRVEEIVEDPETPDNCVDDDVACRECGSLDRGEEMIICGDEHGSVGCGVGVHIDCLDPPLEDVPVEDWFCSDCQAKRESGTSVGKSSKKRASSKSKK